MSMVSVIFRVYAEDGRLDQVVQGVKEKFSPKDIRVDEVAFGIKVIRVMFLYDNTQTDSSKLEASLKGIGGISEIEVEDETLV